jgi:hypothetical protein
MKQEINMKNLENINVMENLENINLGGRFRLTSEGYYLDEKRQVWINDGFRIDNNQPVKAYLFNPLLNNEIIEDIVRTIESDKKNIKLDSAAQKINEKIIPYAVFELSQRPQKDFVHEIPIKQPNVPTPEGKKIPVWIFIVVVVFALFLLCILTAILGEPIIQQFIQTPTP